jgi:GT2 family glycosyltransferase
MTCYIWATAQIRVHLLGMGMTTIISVNFNQPQVTIAFLRSVKKYTHNCDVELILVDNCSTEDHGDSFKSEYEGLIYIRAESNLGFAGGNNLAIQRAKGDYLLFLNNDTEISENLVSVLTQELDANSSIGIISPLIVYYHNPDVIQYAGFTEMNYITCRNNEIGHLDKNLGQYDEVSVETSFCHGAAMMCRASDIDAIGMMDENYFLYYEELDWCEKFKRAGKKIWFTGKTKIYHKESISVGKESPTKTYFMTRNRILYIRKNTNLFTTIIFYLYSSLITIPKQILLYIVTGRPDLVKWAVKGFTWNLSNSSSSKNLGFRK